MLAINTYKEAYTPFAAENSFLFSLVLKIFLIECTLYIHHLLRFKKDQVRVQALLNSNSEVNTMAFVYVASLNIKVRLSNVRAYKIDGSNLQRFDIIIAGFKVSNKLG